MPAFVGEFSLVPLERVISGPGSLRSLPAELDARRCSRVLVVTGRTLGRSSLLNDVTAVLGSRCASVFAETDQHVPSATVDALTARVEAVTADCVLSFGGGSPIDAAKAAVHRLIQKGNAVQRGGAAPHLPHIALPTTLSAGEFTAIAGVTDPATRVKRAVSDRRLAPAVVITDPLLTAATPDWLWAATGVRALDHAVESIYSVRHHPFSDALASRAIAMLVEHLPCSIRSGASDRVEHRGHCQVAAWLSVFGIANTGFGLSHALGHQIGPRWQVAHGFTSCVMLPHAMRFMARVAPERFGPIAAGLGQSFEMATAAADAAACAERMAAFIAQFEVPRRLRDAGVPTGEATDIAAVVYESVERSQVIGRPLVLDELRQMLVDAY
jgi:alcohol dehydrogenase class IV